MPGKFPAHAGSLYRVQSETPIPQQTATRRKQYRSGAAKKHTPETVCVLKITEKCMGKLGGEMKALAKHCGGSHKTVHRSHSYRATFRSPLTGFERPYPAGCAVIKVRHIESYIRRKVGAGDRQTHAAK